MAFLNARAFFEFIKRGEHIRIVLIDPDSKGRLHALLRRLLLCILGVLGLRRFQTTIAAAGLVVTPNVVVRIITIIRTSTARVVRFTLQAPRMIRVASLDGVDVVVCIQGS